MNESSRRISDRRRNDAATFWIPKKIHGYKKPEVMAHVTDLKSTRGVSKWELDTPALVLDLDKLDQNIAKMRASLSGTGVAARPHAKTHKSSDIAKLQIGAGAIGICTAKVSEAEALYAGGVQKIVMTTANVSRSKIQRAMNIRRKNRDFIQAVDYRKRARPPAQQGGGITADVVVDVAVGTRSGFCRRSGARPCSARWIADEQKVQGILARWRCAAHQGVQGSSRQSLAVTGRRKDFDDEGAGLNTEISAAAAPARTTHDEGAGIHRRAGGSSLHGRANSRSQRERENFTDFAPR